jgi:hypothetical protein
MVLLKGIRMKIATNLLLSLLLISFLGCASANKNAYRVVGTTVITVDAAMHGWSGWVSAGKATIADELKVKAAYERYQAAIRLVAGVERSGSIATKFQWDNAANAVATSAGDLVLIINMFIKPANQ